MGKGSNSVLHVGRIMVINCVGLRTLAIESDWLNVRGVLLWVCISPLRSSGLSLSAGFR